MEHHSHDIFPTPCSLEGAAARTAVVLSANWVSPSLRLISGNAVPGSDSARWSVVSGRHGPRRRRICAWHRIPDPNLSEGDTQLRS